MLDEEQKELLQRIATLEEQLSARQRGDEEQAMALSLLQATLEATADGILVVDHSGKVADANRRFFELWRIPEFLAAARDDRAMLSYVLEQLVSPQAFIAKVESLYQEPSSESFDLLEFKDGRVFERYSRPQVLHGKTVGRVWSFRDVTARKQAELEATLIKQQDLLIRAQAAALTQLSTPLIPISDEVMVMPLIGNIDSERAQQVLNTLLTGIEKTRAETIILDITGVVVVDSQVAGALVHAAQAVKLLGAQVLLTGIRAEVAQTLVGLGMELGGLTTRSTLQSGIAYALSRRSARSTQTKR